MTGLCNVSFCIGPFVGVLIANSLAPQPTVWSYRGLFVAQWGFGITSILIAPFMPELVVSFFYPALLTFVQIPVVSSDQGKRRGGQQSTASLRSFDGLIGEAYGNHEGYPSGLP
jgi:hypothetical protein